MSSFICSLGSHLVRHEGNYSLSGEVRVVASEVAIGSRLLEPLVASPLQIQVDAHHAWPEVEVLFDELQDVGVWDGTGLVGVHKDGQWLRHANGV